MAVIIIYLLVNCNNQSLFATGGALLTRDIGERAS
jgi:hypothetical protein